MQAALEKLNFENCGLLKSIPDIIKPSIPSVHYSPITIVTLFTIFSHSKRRRRRPSSMCVRARHPPREDTHSVLLLLLLLLLLPLGWKPKGGCIKQNRMPRP
jgi:hypothetical protein